MADSNNKKKILILKIAETQNKNYNKMKLRLRFVNNKLFLGTRYVDSSTNYTSLLGEVLTSFDKFPLKTICCR